MPGWQYLLECCHADELSTSSQQQQYICALAWIEAWTMPVQAMGIQRYIFFSIHNCERHSGVPLMRIKACTEDFLKQSGVPYTVFRLCGFMQVRLPGSCPCG